MLRNYSIQVETPTQIWWNVPMDEPKIENFHGLWRRRKDRSGQAGIAYLKLDEGSFFAARFSTRRNWWFLHRASLQFRSGFDMFNVFSLLPPSISKFVLAGCVDPEIRNFDPFYENEFGKISSLIIYRSSLGLGKYFELFNGNGALLGFELQWSLERGSLTSSGVRTAEADYGHVSLKRGCHKWEREIRLWMR